MYRVELKATQKSCLKKISTQRVPNVPCGVESLMLDMWAMGSLYLRVPNVPCGVESLMLDMWAMGSLYLRVPNVPCGVESWVEVVLILAFSLSS